MEEMPNAPPAVTFRKADPLQDYYCDGSGAQWSVAKLIDDSKHLPVFDVPIAALDLSGAIWQGYDMISLAFHCKRVNDADLDHPILLDWCGAIADGRHRVLKAIIEGVTIIKARRMTWKPDPCRNE